MRSCSSESKRLTLQKEVTEKIARSLSAHLTTADQNELGVNYSPII